MKLKSVTLFFILLALTVNQLQAQEYDYYVKNKKSILNFNNNHNSKKSTESFYVLNNPKYFGFKFNLKEKNKRFELQNQTHNNFDIYSATIKINFDDNGTPILYSDNTINYSLVDKTEFPKLELIYGYSNINYSEVIKSKKVYFPISESKIIPALKIYYEKENKSYLSIFNAEYDIVYNKLLSFEKDLNTKTANASVFMPDPISSARVEYGGEYVNNSGESNATLEAQQMDVAIECKFDGTNYFLENDFVKIVDFASPNWTVVSNTTGDFSYVRSDRGFQQVNAFYHINEIKKYINYLGFTDAVNYKILVDADGENGHDNSHFHSSGKLEFGAYTGVEEHIPDAEDAEVVVHEYTHAIINSYSEFPSSNERFCLEEAMADYMAVSYATEISDYNWQKVFKWDGNESWSGRLATSTKCYTSLHFSSNPYDNSDIWTAPLMDIYFELDKETTDKLVLHTITALDANTTMEQAALIMMAMDTVYNSHENSMVIFNTFKKYCILNDSHLANDDYELSKFKIINSQQFARGGEMTLEFGYLFSGEIKIYDINGIMVFNTKLNQRTKFNFNSEKLNSGIYIINISTDKDSKSIKLCKYYN